jgi:glutamate racemase
MLVSLAEEGWTRGEIATAIVGRYLAQLPAEKQSPDCVILGCTHFPLLRDAIASVLDTGTAIVDSASTTAVVARKTLGTLGLARSGAGVGQLRLLATDGANRFARVGGMFLGETLSAADIELVDL